MDLSKLYSFCQQKEIPFTALVLLQCIDEGVDGTSMLAQKIGIRPPAVTKHLETLKTKKLIKQKRGAEDFRRTHSSLTLEGEELLGLYEADFPVAYKLSPAAA
jgi:DNA-binding MarR family transcriptional regulator